MQVIFPRPRTVHVLAGLWIALSACLGADAAELRLRNECQVHGPLVTLGDVAEIFGTDATQQEPLAACELFPAPPAGQQRFVRVRELQDLLLSRGVNLAEHRFSGASQVTIQVATDKPTAPPPATPREKPLAAGDAKRAGQQVQEGVLRRLRDPGSRGAWKVDVPLSDEQVRAVLRSTQLSVRGGTPPLEGSQRFELLLETPGGPESMMLDATITRPPEVVVAMRPLARGTLVQERDVQLVSAEEQTDAVGAAHALDEVVGRETLRGIPEGRVLDSAALRRPLAIKRGDVVTVYARTAGIRVRSVARAKEDASQGDLISLESLPNRATFLARVSGFQEAEVFAHAAQADK